MNEEMEIQELKNKILEIGSRCSNCNFCFSACPNFDSTRGFQIQGPSGILQSIFYAVKWEDKLSDSDKNSLCNSLFSCTTCKSCEITCKSISAGVPILEAIEEGRKLLLEKMIGPLPEQRYALESIYKYGNPYGQEPANRLSWLGDLKVKLLPGEKAEVIYYVGCTTSYEPELHNLARSIAKLLRFFEIDFGILEDEVCCGDPARTLGEEGLFHMEAWQNLEKIKSTGAKTILTVSPHCFHTFLNKYESLGNQFHIKHYTEFFHSIFQEKNVFFEKQLPYTITYHDPCYLGKHNDIYDPPRALLRAIPGIKLVEMSMAGINSLCCGGGGGRMYAEVEEERRMADMRAGQALDLKADVIATACPWCHNMLQNAVRDLQMENRIKVRDIAEILAEALNL